MDPAIPSSPKDSRPPRRIDDESDYAAEAAKKGPVAVSADERFPRDCGSLDGRPRHGRSSNLREASYKMRARRLRGGPGAGDPKSLDAPGDPLLLYRAAAGPGQQFGDTAARMQPKHGVASFHWFHKRLVLSADDCRCAAHGSWSRTTPGSSRSTMLAGDRRRDAMVPRRTGRETSVACERLNVLSASSSKPCRAAGVGNRTPWSQYILTRAACGGTTDMWARRDCDIVGVAAAAARRKRDRSTLRLLPDRSL